MKYIRNSVGQFTKGWSWQRKVLFVTMVACFALPPMYTLGSKVWAEVTREVRYVAAPLALADEIAPTIKTVQHYVEKRTGEKLSNVEAIQLALDEERARDLAAWVIFETEKGVAKDWKNCSAWHGLQGLVDFIKAHE